MDLIERVRRAMMATASDSSWVAARAVASGTLVRIARGCFLRIGVLAEVGDDVWEQRRCVDVARILAVVPSPGEAQRESRRRAAIGVAGGGAAESGEPRCVIDSAGSASMIGRVVAFESALVIRGLPVLDRSPDVHVVAPNSRSTKGMRFPAVSFRGELIRGPARLAIHRLDHAGRGAEIASGVVLTDAATTAIDLARFRSPREGVAEVSVLLNRVVGFKREDPAGGRARESEIKADWLRVAGEIGRAPGAARARRVIGAADAGCESIAEGVLTWFLRAHGIRPWRTQVPTSVGSRVLYPDVRIDDAGVALECEGQKKLGTDGREVARNAHALMRRSNELGAAGWRVVFLPAAEILGAPRVLEARLRQVAPEIFDARRGLDLWWFTGVDEMPTGARNGLRADDEWPEPGRSDARESAPGSSSRSDW